MPPRPGSGQSRMRVFAVLQGRFDSVYREKKGRIVRSKRRLGEHGFDDNVFVLQRVWSYEVVPDTRDSPPRLQDIGQCGRWPHCSLPERE